MKNTLSARLSQSVEFLRTDIWRFRSSQLSPRKSFWVRQLRILLLAIRGFAEDRCQLRASALTFYSLLAIVPTAAMAFGIAKGFGFEKLLEKQIMESLQGQQEVIEMIIDFARSLLDNTRGGIVAAAGIVVLFWTVVKLLGNIESSFNDIWGVKTPRTLGRKLSDYLSVMLICPVLLIMATSVTVLITSQVAFIAERLSFLGPVVDVIILFLRILPYAVIWVVFTFIYFFMPNTKVRLKAGVFAGILAGTIYQALQWLYITFQVGVSNYGAMYGSFAALPLFLVWLQLSWLVVLFGAEVSFAEQNVETYEFEPDSLKVSLSFKKLLALIISHYCIKKFDQAKKPPRAEEISEQLEIPIRLARQILFELTGAGVLSEVKVDDFGGVGYQPAYPTENISVADVVERLDRHGTEAVPIAPSKDLDRLRESVDQLRELAAKSPANVRLKDL
jgi:membrane protein